MAEDNKQLIRFLQSENARLQEENRHRAEEMREMRRYMKALLRVHSAVQQFTPEQDILELLDKTLDCALALLDASDGSLMLTDEENEELVFVLVHGAVREVLPGHRFSSRQGVAGWVAENKQPVSIDNVYSDPRFWPALDERFGFATRSLVAVPLIARGRTLGVLEALNKQSGDSFTEEDVNLLSVLATIAATAMDYAASTPIDLESDSLTKDPE